MEPGIHQGDLILARAPDDYRIGDIAAYQNKSVGKVVLHRIISRDADLFTLKGDNNSFIDEYRPTRLDLIGVPWVLIPGAGNILLWLATPLHAALVVGAFFFVMLGGLAFFVKKRRRLGRKSLPAKKQLRFPVPSPSRTVHSELLALGSLAVFALAVGFAWFASTRPAMKTEFTNVQYEQRAGFHYSAEVEPGPIYDNPQISTGDPVFLRLVRELVVEFNYELDSQFPHGISGTGRLILEISDTNGWIRQRALQTETSFVGDTLSLSGTIDLAELEKVFEDFVDLTGLNRQSFVLRVIAEVQADGLVAGQPCCDVFAPDPQLVFSLDPLQLILTPGSADQVEVVQPGTVKVARLEPNYLRFLVADLEVDSARKYAVLTVPFLMALIATSFFYRLPPEDEPSRIEQDYGHLLVLAERLDFPQHHFRLRQMKSLVRLAERFDCVILHSAEGRVHTYLIYEGSAAYIYQAAGRNEGAASRVMTQKILQLSLLLLTGLVLTSLVSAFASANTVATSSTAVDVRPIGADDLKPSDCAAITLTNVVVGSVNVSGTNANDLVLGSAVADVMNGAAGNDCILGGGGDDELAGAGGQDVCIGGPGTDKFKGTCNTKIQ